MPNSKPSFGAAPGGAASLGSRNIGEVRMISDMRCDPGPIVKKWLQGGLVRYRSQVQERAMKIPVLSTLHGVH